MRDGYSAPLGPPFTSPSEGGRNCEFSIKTATLQGGEVSVGVVGDVLAFFRRWMVRDGHRGSNIFAVYVDGRRMARGTISPIVDPAVAGA